jgi:hypothetical protein
MVNEGRNQAMIRDRQTTLSSHPPRGEVYFMLRVAYLSFTTHGAPAKPTPFCDEIKISFPRSSAFTFNAFREAVLAQGIEKTKPRLTRFYRLLTPPIREVEWHVAINHLPICLRSPKWALNTWCIGHMNG